MEGKDEVEVGQVQPMQRKGKEHCVEGLADMSSTGCNKGFTLGIDEARKGPNHMKVRTKAI